MYSVDNLLHQDFRPNGSSAFHFPFVSQGEQDLSFLKGIVPVEMRKRVAIVKDKNEDHESEDEILKEEENAKANIHTDEEDLEEQDSKNNRNLSETFVAVIAQSILSVPTKRMTLSSIYNYIAKNYPHFDKEKGPGWRNSVRHNLSSNDCFVKASRAENGKGHYWMIHPKDLPEFSKGNFRRPRKPRRPRCSHSLGCLSERAMFASALGTGSGYHYHPYSSKHPDFTFPLVAASPEMYPRPYGLTPRYDRYQRDEGYHGYHGFSSSSAAYLGFPWPDNSAFRNYAAAAALQAPAYFPYVVIPPVNDVTAYHTDSPKSKDK